MQGMIFFSGGECTVMYGNPLKHSSQALELLLVMSNNVGEDCTGSQTFHVENVKLDTF